MIIFLEDQHDSALRLGERSAVGAVFEWCI